MNQFLIGLFAFLLFLQVAAPGVIAGAPAISAREALDLAQEQLDMRGLQKSVYVESIALKSASLLGAQRVWTVLWSEKLQADGGLVEIGAEVDMKGRVVRLVKKPATGPRQPL